MTVSPDQNNQNNYHVSKGYHKQVSGPLDYLIKILGIDCEVKKPVHKRRSCKDAFFRAPNEKFVNYLSILICKYRQRVKKAKLKTMHYEEVEAV